MRILIAEDQALQRRILEAGLRKAGYEADSQADGQAAWERFLEAPARMVITDWTMPRLDGVDLIRRIRELDLDRHTYVILLTARDKKDDVVDGLSSGADDYLTKPFDHRELAARVAIGQRMISLEDRLLASQERLERLATYDGLTGLLNRQALLERADGEVHRTVRNGTPMGVVMLDVDHFKSVNDEHGHVQGDEVLLQVANALSEDVRPYDLVGRWGGEEFLLVLPGASLEEARQVAERVREGVSRATIKTPSGETLQIQISAGVASSLPHSRANMDTLLLEADEALLIAKRSGRNQVRVAGAPADEQASA